jgi:hypothetical protein
MPGFARNIAELNRRLHPDNIKEFSQHREAFEPGKKLDAGLILAADDPGRRVFQLYLDRLPEAIRDTVRNLIHGALSNTPPTPITFAWAPAYDYEMTIWQAECGITVLFRSRYPSDPRPKATDEAAAA